MKQQSGTKRIAAIGIALCVIFVTLVVARSPIASAGTFQGTIVPSPNAIGQEGNYLQNVSCTSTTFCMAAGYYVNSGGYDQTLVEEWNGTSWSIVTSPNTSTTQSNYLYGVSCVSNNSCMAVGYYLPSSYQTLTEEWNGTSWSIVTSPNTSAAQSNQLQNVSCTNTSFCMAAGYYTNVSGYNQTLIEEWNGSAWSIITSPNTSTTEYNQLYGVSCVTASDCMAAGDYFTGSYDQTLIEEWNGTAWSIVTSPNTSTTQNNQLYGVSCVTASDCWAVGYYQNSSSYSQTLIEDWNGTSWSIVTSPNTSTTENNQLYGVSCVTASDCWAVGYSYYSVPQTLVEQWNGTSWSIVSSPNTSTTDQNGLQAMSCTSTTSCMAVGYYYTGSYYQTLIEQWNGTSWSIVSSPDISTTQDNSLYGMSCTSTSFCMTVGAYYQNSSSYYQTLIEQWNGTSWSIVSSPNTSTTQSNYLYGVSCVSATSCMAVGYYQNSSNYYQTLIEEWNGSSWSIVSSPNATTTEDNFLYGVSCTSATSCMAAGYYYTGAPYQTLIEEWNGSNWSIVTSPNTSAAQSNQLQAMSCTSTSFCMAAGDYINSGGYNQTLVEEWNGTS